RGGEGKGGGHPLPPLREAEYPRARDAARELREPGRQLRWRPRLDEQLVHAAQLLLLLGIEALEIDQFVERRHSSPSRMCASRWRPLRVRVLTVPSGIPSVSATSLCERPRQYASEITSRS